MMGMRKNDISDSHSTFSIHSKNLPKSVANICSQIKRLGDFQSLEALPDSMGGSSPQGIAV